MIIAYLVRTLLYGGAWQIVAVDEMGKRRGLGRGLDDLMATHDTDLPFLDTYGQSDGEPESGLPPSAGGDDPAELLQACIRLLNSEGAQVKTAKDRAEVGDWLVLSAIESGVEVSANSTHALPLVASDLQEPGFETGSLSADRCLASVVLTRWGVATRRLLSRLLESQS
jgi:hypothetical protein